MTSTFFCTSDLKVNDCFHMLREICLYVPKNNFRLSFLKQISRKHSSLKHPLPNYYSTGRSNKDEFCSRGPFDSKDYGMAHWESSGMELKVGILFLKRDYQIRCIINHGLGCMARESRKWLFVTCCFSDIETEQCYSTSDCETRISEDIYTTLDSEYKNTV